MITDNSILPTITKLFLLTILLSNQSCSSIKVDKSNEIANSLNDFIDTYKSHNFEKSLDVLMMSTNFENGKTIYIINDAPLNVFYGDLNKMQKEGKYNLSMGRYKNIYCKMEGDSLENIYKFLDKLDNVVFKTAQKAQEAKGNDGKTYTFDLSLTNWNPQLIIIYNISDGTKKIIEN